MVNKKTVSVKVMLSDRINVKDSIALKRKLEYLKWDHSIVNPVPGAGGVCGRVHKLALIYYQDGTVSNKTMVRFINNAIRAKIPIYLIYRRKSDNEFCFYTFSLDKYNDIIFGVNCSSEVYNIMDNASVSSSLTIKEYKEELKKRPFTPNECIAPKESIILIHRRKRLKL